MKSLHLAVAARAVATAIVLTLIAGRATPVFSAEAAAAPAAPAAAAKRPAAPAEPAVATVNGISISRTVFDYYVKSVAGGKSSSELTPEQRSQVLDNLIRAVLLSQQASKDGLDKNSDVASQLTLTRWQVLGEAAASSYLKDKQATDAQLHQEYDAQVANIPKTEYHARHILVPSQGDAQFIIDQLKGGASFEELAKTKSTDSSKDQGGDLGWFPAQQMVKPFADAVVALKKGETTQTPVQTPFGWHVIQLLDTREETPPQFDAVKQRVLQLVQSKKVRAYQEELEKTATIKKNL